GGAIHGFHEKSEHAPSIPGHPGMIYASMGNYIFSAKALYRELHADAQRPNSRHDFGRDILPGMLGTTNMRAYDFQTNVIPALQLQRTGAMWAHSMPITKRRRTCVAWFRHSIYITRIGLFARRAIPIRARN